MQLKCDSRIIKLFWVSLVIVLKVMNFTLSRIYLFLKAVKLSCGWCGTWFKLDIVLMIVYCVNLSWLKIACAIWLY